jgi:phi LC3 family holin
MKERFRNKAFWTALVAFVIMVAKQFNLFDVPEDINAIVDAGLGLLIMLGIIIDPTTPGVKDGE